VGHVRIISYSSETFSDRAEAGRLLAEALDGYKGQNAVVLGIPRGGLIVARELAHALDAELDVVLARKVGAPGNPEFAIGAVAESGRLFMNRNLPSGLSIDPTYLKEQHSRASAEIARCVAYYREAKPSIPLTSRITIIADDGAATGTTFQAALWSARQERPEKLIAALPVAPNDTVHRLSEDADEVICLRVPSTFRAVGEFYTDFEQLDEEDAMHLLEQEAARNLRR
jgi:predicted phosphoribosyltransferase